MPTLDDHVNKSIRARIRNIRRKKRLSIRQAALLCEIPESSYSCLENGFYRISLLNLKKILDGLGVGIEEVWPRDKGTAPGTLTFAPDFRRLNYFRFQEVCTLSESSCAALLRGPRWRIVYSTNVAELEKRKLLKSMQTGLPPEWVMFRRQAKEKEIRLCLLQGVVEDHLERLIGIYLDLWMASDLTAVTG